MAKYRIRAHYDPGTVILGTVEAENQYEALSAAESMGLLSDPEAVDFTASVIAPAQQPQT